MTHVNGGFQVLPLGQPGHEPTGKGVTGTVGVDDLGGVQGLDGVGGGALGGDDDRWFDTVSEDDGLVNCRVLDDFLAMASRSVLAQPNWKASQKASASDSLAMMMVA